MDCRAFVTSGGDIVDKGLDLGGGDVIHLALAEAFPDALAWCLVSLKGFVCDLFLFPCQPTVKGGVDGDGLAVVGFEVEELLVDDGLGLAGDFVRLAVNHYPLDIEAVGALEHYITYLINRPQKRYLACNDLELA